MRRKPTTQDFASGALGFLALALGAGAMLGILRPGDAGMDNNVPVLSFSSLIAGVVALYFSRTAGPSHQIAVLGCGIAILAVALFGGSVAIEALLDS